MNNLSPEELVKKHLDESDQDLRRRVAALTSNHNLLVSLDEQTFQYSVSNTDLLFDVIKNIFIVSFTGYFTSLAVSPSIFNNLIFIQNILLVTIIISILLGIIIFVWRIFLIKKIKEIIKGRILSIQSIYDIESKINNDFWNSKKEIRDMISLKELDNN